MSEGTETALTTATDFTTVAQNIGDYVPGKTAVSAMINAPNRIGMAYLLRQGLIAALFPVANTGVTNVGPVPLLAPITLQAGDIIRVMPLTAASRMCYASVMTNQGVQRIFQTATAPSGAATTALTDLQTGNSVGDTLAGSSIVSAWVTSVDGGKITSPGGGIIVQDAAGNVVGSVVASDPAKVQPTPTRVNIPVQLNWTMSLITNA